MLSVSELVQTVLYPRSYDLFFNTSDGAPVTITYGFSNAASFPADYVHDPLRPDLAGTLNSTNVTAFEPAQIAAAEAVLNLISSYTRVTFVRATANPAEAQIRFWNTDVFTRRGFTIGQQTPTFPLREDVFMSPTRFPSGPPTPGTEGFYAMLHEVLHAIGFKHPNEIPRGDITNVGPWADGETSAQTQYPYRNHKRGRVLTSPFHEITKG